MAQRYLSNKRFFDIEKVHCDVLIIGSGIAGVYTALQIKTDKIVVVITKENIEINNSVLAQGGIAVSLDKGDSPELHFNDTIYAGAGLCKTESVWVLVNEAAERINKLLEYGVQFDRISDDQLSFGREAAHSKNRIIHAGDTTGKEVCDKLVDVAKRKNNIRFMEKIFAIDLITEDQKVKGVLTFDENEEKHIIFVSDTVVCAAGGFGGLYLKTTNPEIATGDGVCMAYRAGASLADMEFLQFHPTVLHHRDNQHFLISEAVRGEGACLKNHSNDRFMVRYHELLELAPRDVVARAIFSEMRKENVDNEFLDITFRDKSYLMNRFPNIYKTCLSYGIDMSKDYVPIAPAEHYCMGGIETDIWGQTNIRGFYACGEAACTGIHGANRLASNSLLEGLVFGGRIAQVINSQQINPNDIFIKETDKPIYDSRFGARELIIKDHIREIMTQYVGIIRDETGLRKALAWIHKFSAAILGKEPFLPIHFEIINMIQLAELIIENALLRKESRGGHYRSDYILTDDKWRRRIIREIGRGVRYED